MSSSSSRNVNEYEIRSEGIVNNILDYLSSDLLAQKKRVHASKFIKRIQARKAFCCSILFSPGPLGRILSCLPERSLGVLYWYLTRTRREHWNTYVSITNCCQLNASELMATLMYIWWKIGSPSTSEYLSSTSSLHITWYFKDTIVDGQRSSLDHIQGHTAVTAREYATRSVGKRSGGLLRLHMQQ